MEVSNDEDLDSGEMDHEGLTDADKDTSKTQTRKRIIVRVRENPSVLVNKVVVGKFINKRIT